MSEPLESPAEKSGATIRPTLALLSLALVFVIAVPPFLRMPLTNDPVYYDLQAYNLWHGGMLYRDIVEPNFPGVVWIHALVRPVVGPSSEALRLVDFLFLSGIVVLFGWGLRVSGISSRVAVWCAAGVYFFYLPQPEWSHCQRDTWVLLPAGAAFVWRLRNLIRSQPAEASFAALFRRSIFEGFLWGVAIWIKPHVIVPCCVVWLMSSLAGRNIRRAAADGFGLLVGGVIAGALGMGWLVGTGTWPAFWDNIVHLNPLYLAARGETWTVPKVLSMFFRLFPWGVLHLLAAPIALLWCVTAIRRKRDSTDSVAKQEAGVSAATKALWAALYLGWMFQAIAFQILFDYVHIPGIILAMLIVGIWAASTEWRRTVVLAAFAFVIGVCWFSPALAVSRLQLWPECVFQGNFPELRNRLRRIQEPDWVELEHVAQYLEKQDLHDGDLICFGNHLVHLYPRLGIQPTNRFVYQAWYLRNIPALRSEIWKDFDDHPPRFIVSDLVTVLGVAKFSAEPGAFGPNSLPAGIPSKFLKSYPLRYPVVYRSGGLLVHRYESPNGS